MSRIGKLPIPIPEGVTLQVKGQTVEVKGPKGTLTQDMLPEAQVRIDGQQALVTVKDPNIKRERALWGLYRTLIANMVEGVTKGYEKKLEINGIGFKAAIQGTSVVLNLGFSHPVNFPLPAGITGKVEKNILTLGGIDKQLVGETAAKIRELKPPEPYKGKGIKYVEEVIRRKAGKVVKAGG